MYDQIAYYSVLSQQRMADRTAGRFAATSGREPSRSRRSRRPRRRAR